MASGRPPYSCVLAVAAACLACLPSRASQSGQAPAPQPPAVPKGCAAAEHRQFDFWLGTWDVTGPKGKRLGRNVIARSPTGCWVTEHWQSGPGFSGTSLNAWDAAHKRWRQFWVGSDGGVLRLEGGLRGKAMVMEGVLPGAEGGVQRQRVSWTPKDDGSITQHWQTSDDDGKSWATVFLGIYRRESGRTP